MLKKVLSPDTTPPISDEEDNANNYKEKPFIT